MAISDICCGEFYSYFQILANRNPSSLVHGLLNIYFLFAFSSNQYTRTLYQSSSLFRFFKLVLRFASIYGHSYLGQEHIHTFWIEMEIIVDASPGSFDGKIIGSYKN